MAFFRLAEIEPKSCLELLPRFLELLTKIEQTHATQLPLVWKRFAGTFDTNDVAYFLNELKAKSAYKRQPTK